MEDFPRFGPLMTPVVKPVVRVFEAEAKAMQQSEGHEKLTGKEPELSRPPATFPVTCS